MSQEPFLQHPGPGGSDSDTQFAQSEQAASLNAQAASGNGWFKRRGVRRALALALFSVLLVVVSPIELARELAGVHLGYLTALIAISAALVWVSAAKWRLFMGPAAPSTFKLFQLYLVGYFVNTLVPSYVGGDATRSYLAGKHAGQMKSASATLLERYTGLVAMFALGAIAALVPLGVQVPWAVKLAVLSLVAGFIGVSVVLFNRRLFLVSLSLWPTRWFPRLRDRVQELQEVVGQSFSERNLIARAMMLSLVYHCLTVVNTAAAAYAVGWESVPLLELFVVLPIILTIGGLPITPSGLGLQEGAFVYFLSLLGATGAQALAIAVLLRAKTYLLALVGWVVFLREQRAGSGSRV